MSGLFSFPFPKINGNSPIWNGREFEIGQVKIDFLSYGAEQSGWSAGLTELHERVAGEGKHPMDALSRFYAEISVTPILQKKGVLLDVGCSSGYFLQQILASHPLSNLIGADYLPEVVQASAKKNPGTPMLQFDLRTCPLVDECLDGVVALNVLEHIDDDCLALRQIHRILKRGGRAHIEVPAGPELYDYYDEVLKHYRRYTRDELVSKSLAAGFKIVKVSGIGHVLYPLFCLAKKRNIFIGRKLEFKKKAELVAESICKTSNSFFIKSLLSFEKKIHGLAPYFQGIRHYIILEKP
jgi:SAM-dependent methyltransferase